jgi:hypothetical protein
MGSALWDEIQHRYGFVAPNGRWVDESARCVELLLD